MTTSIQTMRIDSILSKAKEHIELGDKNLAFEDLKKAIEGRRVGRTHSDSTEDIIKLFIELCVEFKKTQELKTGLTLFRNLCQQQVVAFGRVFKFYIKTIKDRVKQLSISETQDEESENIFPELVIHKAIHDTNDKSKKAETLSYLKLLWEAYRTGIELTRNQTHLEPLFHEIALRGLNYCKKYKRKTEFKRFADLLRSQKVIPQEGENRQQYHKNIFMNIETRLRSISVASDLELWNDAYKTVEDIHGLLMTSRYHIKPSQLATYYEQLTKLFWVSKNYLLHAYAYYKLFNVKVSQLEITDDETKHVSSCLLLAVLSIPNAKIYDNPHYDDINDIDFNDREKQLRMASLMDLTSLPAKETLLQQIVSEGVVDLVYPELRDLYSILYVDFDPLSLGQELTKVFEFLEKISESEGKFKKMNIYIKPLRDVVANILLQQLSKVYQNIQLQDLLALLPRGQTLNSIERATVEFVRQRNVQITVDHQNGVIHFNKGQATLDYENIRREIVKFARKLKQCSKMIHKEEILRKREEARKQLATLKGKCEQEHTELLERKEFIEKKKAWEEIEKKKLQAKIDEYQKQLLMKKKQDEMKRIQEETHKLEMQKKRQEILKQKKRLAQEMITNFLDRLAGELQEFENVVDTKAFKKLLDRADNTDMTTELIQLFDSTRQKIEKVKKEKERKQNDIIRNIEFMERARRDYEIPIMRKELEKQKDVIKQMHLEDEKKALEAFEKHAQELKAERDRILRMQEDKETFVQQLILPKREEEYKKLKAEQDERREKAYAQWKEKKDKMLEKLEKVRKEKEEKEKKKREEEEKRRQEEEKRRQDDLKKQKLLEIQFQKQLEVEKKLEQQQAEMKRSKLMREDRSKSKEAESKEEWRSSKVKPKQKEESSWRSRFQNAEATPENEWQRKKKETPATTDTENSFWQRNKTSTSGDADNSRPWQKKQETQKSTTEEETMWGRKKKETPTTPDTDLSPWQRKKKETSTSVESEESEGSTWQKKKDFGNKRPTFKKEAPRFPKKKEDPEQEVDEDGFTKVKKKGGRW